MSLLASQEIREHLEGRCGLSPGHHVTSSLHSLEGDTVENNTPTTNLRTRGSITSVVPGLPGRDDLTLELQNPSLSGDKVDNGIGITRIDQNLVVSLLHQSDVSGDDGAVVEGVVGTTALLPGDGLGMEGLLDRGSVEVAGNVVVNAGVSVLNITLLAIVLVLSVHLAHAVDERMREADVILHAISSANITQDIIGLTKTNEHCGWSIRSALGLGLGL